MHRTVLSAILILLNKYVGKFVFDVVDTTLDGS